MIFDISVGVVVGYISFVIGIILLTFIFRIRKLFSGLERLEKPWTYMFISVVFFLILQLADIFENAGVQFQYIHLVHDLAGITHLGLMGLSLYLFKKAWETPKG